MTTQDDINVLEAERKRLYNLYVAPIEEKLQNAYRQLNEERVEVDLSKVDVAAIADKYKIVAVEEAEAVKSIG